MTRHRRVASAAVAAAALAVYGCGGGGGGPAVRPDPPVPPPVVRPDPPAPPPAPLITPGGSLPPSYQGPTIAEEGAEYYTVDRAGVPGAYAWPGGDAVRIGIQDDAVDFTHPDFRGRIELDGASFAYRRLDLIDDPAPDAFDHCDASNRCRVYLVDSTGDRSTIDALARTVLEDRDQGLPPDADRRFLYDVAEDGFGWFELPALGLDDPERGAQHGTGVASVAARHAPDAVLVPMATNFRERFEVTFELQRGTPLRVQDDPWLEDSYLQLADWESDADIDRTLAAAWRRWYDSADIINSSFSTDVDLSTANGRHARDDAFARMRTLNAHLPQRWRAQTQADRPEGERTIRVLAAGNEREDGGDDARSLEALVVHEFDELWGHNVVATALNEARTALADYANICGSRPADWDSGRHGRHFCLAAPGTHPIAVPGGSSDDGPRQGTSYAAPYVSGVLARMMAQSRGQVGNTELVKRMMDTADNRGVFGNRSLYGAGVIDPHAALGAVGAPTTGTSSNRAAIGSTALRLPAAYGDAARHVAGTEIASFDAWNFPFWTPAGELIANGARPLDPIPDFAEADRTGGCFVIDGYAPDAMCVPSAPASARGAPLAGAGRGTAFGGINGYIAADGAGGSVRLSESVTVAGFARSAGRLDGQAVGAFSFAGGSSLGGIHFARSQAIDDAGRWRLDGGVSFALDMPQGIGQSEGSMFEAGPALLSSWRIGLAHNGEDARTRLTVSQPPRAESGTARLTFPSGRQLDGTHVHASRTFSLRPTRRMVTAALVHRRPFAGGEAVAMLYHARNPGHTTAAPDHGGGLAWRLAF